MSAKSRREQTDALLALIDEVVTGHETQHSPESAPGDVRFPSVRELFEASFAQQMVPLIEEAAVVMRRLQVAVGLTGQAFMEFMEQVARTGKLPPVPAKAAHQHRYGRGR